MYNRYFLKYLTFITIIFHFNVLHCKAQQNKYSDEQLYEFCGTHSSGSLQSGVFVLKNDYLAVVFKQISSGNMLLNNIYDLTTKRKYLGYFPEDFWEVTFTDPLCNESIELSSYSTVNYSINFPNDNEVEIIWGNISLKEENNVVDVKVIVRIDEDKPFSYWKINVNNKSKKYGIKDISFPKLHIPSINGDKENDFLVIPADVGMVSKNPWKRDRNDWHFHLTYPDRYIMQFRAFYEENSGGIYLADYDSKGFEKTYKAIPNQDEDNIEFSVIRKANNIGKISEDFEMDYESVIGIFKGDWYDACRIYRKWAIKQPWAVPLAKRNDIPEWYKRDPATFVMRTPGVNDMEIVVDKTAEFVENLGINFPSKEIPAHLLWYTWQHYDPDNTILYKTGWKRKKGVLPSCDIHAGNYLPARKGFDKAVKKIQDMGFKISVFMNTRLYDQGVAKPDPKLVRPWVVKKPDGTFEVYSNRYQLWDMCRATNGWQQYYTKQAAKAIKEYGVKGIYLDSFGGISHPCFDKEHGHSLGGGTYQRDAMMSFGLYVRNKVKSVDSDAILTDENCAECLFPCIDGDLIHNILWPDIAPLKATVYHDYMLMYGRNLGVGKSTSMKIAFLLVSGFKLGRIDIGMPDALKELFLPENNRYLIYLRKALRIKAKSADWLSLGEMLRQPTIENVPLVQAESRKKQIVEMPAILSGAFKSYKDGSVAVVFTNYTDQPITSTCNFDLGEYLPNYNRFTKFSIIDYLSYKNSKITTEDGLYSSEGGSGEFVNSVKQSLTLNFPPKSIKIFVYIGIKQ